MYISSDLANCNDSLIVLPARRRLGLGILMGLSQACRPLAVLSRAPLAARLVATSWASLGGLTHAEGLPSWLAEGQGPALIERLIERSGLPAPWVLAQFQRVERQDRALALVNPPADAPPSPRSLSRTLERNLDPRTIDDGRSFLRTHQQALSRAQETYGVPASVIGGILGVETRFGRATGTYPAVDTLTSLALLSGRRQDFYQDELLALLQLGFQLSLDLSTVRCSYAGALGIPQFMPSSWQRWAVDFDQDGRANLLESPVDAIGSVANFLAQHGWQRGLPSHVALQSAAVPTKSKAKAKAPSRVQASPDRQAFIVTGLEARHTVAEMAAAGLLPPRLHWAPQMAASFVELPEPDRPPVTWLASSNFFAITRYNRSYLYAASVLSLADALEKAVASGQPLRSGRHGKGGKSARSAQPKKVAPASRPKKATKSH